MKPNLICQETATVLDVLQIIKDNGKGIAFIIDQQEKVVGVLTDGDIRNALLNGHQLNESIKTIYNRKFVFSLAGEKPEKVLTKANERIKIIPLLDEDHRYVDYYEFARQLHVPVATPILNGNEFKYVVDAFLSTWISSTGSYINAFEKLFAKFCGTKHAVAVSNGTTALHVALLALGIGPGDEVIVPDLTFAATINCVLHANATPVIVDINRDDWCIDPKAIEAAITPLTKAIIPVHLYGQPCNMDKLMLIAKKHKLFIVEDAAEAHGATFKGRKVGSFGEVGCFSFYGNKVLTTGEGGMCVTNSDELATKIRTLRDHGMSKERKYWHDVLGYNYRMTNIQAAIGLGQLERIEQTLADRQALEDRYRKVLGTCSQVTLQEAALPDRSKITWLISVLLEAEVRDMAIENLKAVGFDTRPFFYPLSAMPLYQEYVHSAKISHEVSAQGINLPTVAEMTDIGIAQIKDILCELQSTSSEKTV